MSEIVKTKFVCKNTMSINKTTIFIEGNTYEGEYEAWSNKNRITWSRGYEVNGGWRKYWIKGEDGEMRELPRARFRAVFHYDDLVELRNNKIDEILKK